MQIDVKQSPREAFSRLIDLTSEIEVYRAEIAKRDKEARELSLTLAPLFAVGSVSLYKRRNYEDTVYEVSRPSNFAPLEVTRREIGHLGDLAWPEPEVQPFQGADAAEFGPAASPTLDFRREPENCGGDLRAEYEPATERQGVAS